MSTDDGIRRTASNQWLVATPGLLMDQMDQERRMDKRSEARRDIAGGESPVAKRADLCTGDVNGDNTRHSMTLGRAVREPADATRGTATVQATVTAFALALGTVLCSTFLSGNRGASSGTTQGAATVAGGLNPNSTANASKSQALPSSMAPGAATAPRSSAMGAGQASSTLGVPGSTQSIGAGGQGPSGSPISPHTPFRPNIINIVMDDSGRLQFSGWDAENSWPAGYPYPPTPWLDGLIERGITYTNARNSPRCSPYRSEVMTGRHAHVTPGHVQGTRIGEIPTAVHQGQGFPFNGLLDEHRPWPKVALESNSGYATALFGKWHLYKYGPNGEGGGDNEVQNRRSAVDVGGFDLFEEALRTHGLEAGAPLFGYFGFRTYKMERLVPGFIGPVNEPSEASGGRFMGTYFYDKITSWIDAQALTDTPFVAQYWMNLPHGKLPAWDGTGDGPLGADAHPGTFSAEEMVPDAVNVYGAIDFAGSQYDEDGVFWTNSQFPASECIYGPEGRCNLLWRRAYAMIQAFDRTCQAIDTWLATTHPEVHANTIWMVGSDNGVSGHDIEPIRDDKANALSGGVIGPVIPPTVESFTNGTETEMKRDGGTPYHHPQQAKGKAFEEGVLNPFVVSGPPLPASVRGTKSPALISSVDMYPTILDMIAGPVPPGDLSGRRYWKDTLGPSDLADVDGKSFLATLFDPTARVRDYTFVQAFSPAAATGSYETKLQRGLVNRAGWKLIYQLDPDNSPPLNGFELYNLNVDPREQNDLYTSTDAQAVLHRSALMARYDEITQ